MPWLIGEVNDDDIKKCRELKRREFGIPVVSGGPETIITRQTFWDFTDGFLIKAVMTIVYNDRIET